MIVLTQTQGISYGLAEEPDVDEMTGLLAGVFSRSEPLAVATGLTFDEMQAIVGHLGRRIADAGLSVIARDQQSGRLIGASLTDDFAIPPPDDIDVLPGKFRPIAEVLEELDQQYRKAHRLNPGEVLHLLMVAIAPDSGGKGVASMLLTLTLEHGKQKGYVKAVGEATGKVSQHIFRKHGFVERFHIRYGDFLYEGKPVFNSISEHEALILMERNLGE